MGHVPLSMYWFFFPCISSTSHLDYFYYHPPFICSRFGCLSVKTGLLKKKILWCACSVWCGIQLLSGSFEKKKTYLVLCAETFWEAAAPPTLHLATPAATTVGQEMCQQGHSRQKCLQGVWMLQPWTGMSLTAASIPSLRSSMATWMSRSASLLRDRLVGLVVKASASRAEDPRFESHLRQDFWGVESYHWLKNWHSSCYPARCLAL